jgi:hypothetical protein
MNFSLGCDPECFLQDAAGSLISVIDKIGGTKLNPQPLPIGEGLAVQEDNVALEYNIPPSGSQEDFTKNVQRAMYYLSTRVAELGLQFSHVSAASFPMEQLMDPRAMEFGCDPDFNAWANGRRNPRPKAADNTLRTAGGHVHVGHKFMTKRAAIDFIKFMDLYLGVPSVVMDKGDLRKQLYGKAGAYRIKPYGVEYRSLSNFWVFNTKLTDWVWTSTAAAMDAWQACELEIDEEGPSILEAINKNNKDVAMMLIDKYKLETVYA